MELLERGNVLAELERRFDAVKDSGGQCVFIAGEAGLGKTSVVNVFCQEHADKALILKGYCDDMFVPRPLAPVYDIAGELGIARSSPTSASSGKSDFFNEVFNSQLQQKATTIVVFEDVHWADAATLDFIKFFGRRISKLKCLFLLTYRDNEVDSRHPLRNVIAQLPSREVSRLLLLPLSADTVHRLATARGYDGKELFAIAGGNPFYVTEILASYSVGIPENIRDSILAVFNRLDPDTRRMWQLLSVCPYGCRDDYFETLSGNYLDALTGSFDLQLLYLKEHRIFFKHELYRRAVESSLSALEIVQINRKVIAALQHNFEVNNEIEHLIHHAMQADEALLVVRFAPVAAVKASTLGAHFEAARLYKSAIAYYRGNEKSVLLVFYRSYAYECYLTNQMREAIAYTEKALQLLDATTEAGPAGDLQRFLSRVWWFEGNRINAESFGLQAIESFKGQHVSYGKAMAFSNMSQLMMLAERKEACVFWGEQAIEMAQELNAADVLSHALNNVGVVLIQSESRVREGIDMLRRSLDIALRNGYHEHAARAYTNFSARYLLLKDFGSARSILIEGIRYCEDKDLDSWTAYMQAVLARLDLETGRWNEAYELCLRLLGYANQNSVVKLYARSVLITIKIRRGEEDAESYFQSIQEAAFVTGEMQRILPLLSALLEYEWISGKKVIADEAIANTVTAMQVEGDRGDASAFAHWLYRARKQEAWLPNIHEAYDLRTVESTANASAYWQQKGCKYEYALCLFAGSDDDRRKALKLISETGANAVLKRMKFELRAAGIRKIPAGVRRTTSANAAQLTAREVDVLRLINEGMQNKQIASALFVSVKTVEHHISAIIYKLEAKSRATAIIEAKKLGLII